MKKPNRTLKLTSSTRCESECILNVCAFTIESGGTSPKGIQKIRCQLTLFPIVIFFKQNSYGGGQTKKVSQKIWMQVIEKRDKTIKQERLEFRRSP